LFIAAVIFKGIATADDHANAPSAVVRRSISVTQSTASPTLVSGRTWASANDLILAFLISDGPDGAVQSFRSVTGCGLDWTMVRRANGQPGTAEIWQANPTEPVADCSVTAVRARPGTEGLATLVVYDNALMGNSAAATGDTDNAKVRISGREGSLLFAVGHDADSATPRLMPPGQALIYQDLSAGDQASWVQRATQPMPVTARVTMGAVEPKGNRFDFAAVEIRAAASTPPAPDPASPAPAAASTTTPPAAAPPAATATASASAPADTPPPVTTFDPLTYDWSQAGGTPSAPLTGNNGVLIQGKTITATGAGVSAIFGASFTVRDVAITSEEDAIDSIGDGPFLVEYSKLTTSSTAAGAHADGVQSWAGSNMTFRRNYITGYSTSAMLFKTDKGPISNITISENYLANPTGYWTLYVMDAGNGFGRPTFVDITNNTFGPGGHISSGSAWGSQATFCHTRAQRQAAIDGGNAAAASWIVWDGNTDATGNIVAPPAPAVWM
jgi:hypothetical protein